MCNAKRSSRLGAAWVMSDRSGQVQGREAERGWYVSAVLRIWQGINDRRDQELTQRIDHTRQGKSIA